MRITLPHDIAEARKMVVDGRKLVIEQELSGDMVLDVRNIDEFDDVLFSHAIGLSQQVKISGRRFTICGLHEHVLDVMKELHLDQAFEIQID